MTDMMLVNGIFFLVNLCVFVWNHYHRCRLVELSRDNKEQVSIAQATLSENDAVLAEIVQREARTRDLTEDFYQIQENILRKMAQETTIIVNDLVKRFDPPINIDGVSIRYRKRDLKKVDIGAVDDIEGFEICDNFIIRIKSGSHDAEIPYSEFAYDEAYAVANALKKLVELSEDV